MPDWTNEADYPFDENTPPTQWAWEFLRRNPAYRDDFAEWKRRIATLKAELGAGWRQSDRAKARVPEPLPGESEGAWALRCAESGEKARILSLEQFCAERWGLQGRMHDPDKPWHSSIRFIRQSPYPRLLITEDDVWSVLTERETEDGGAVVAVRDGVALIAIDLAANIERQLRAVKNALTSNPSRIPPCNVAQEFRKRAKIWNRYLRALDAVESGASKFQIGQVLGFNKERLAYRHPGPEVTEWLKQAVSLRETGYRRIASGLE